MALPLLAAAAPSIIQGVSGFLQARRGRRLAKQNVRPMYQIPDEYKQNLAIAEDMARTGLGQQQYNQASQNITRNQTAGLRALSRSANPGAGIASLLRSSNDATNNLNVQDANAQRQNQMFAIQQRGVLGQQKLAKQNWDRLQRYQEQAQAAAALQGAGQQNMFGALNNLSSLAQTSMAGSDPNNLNRLLGLLGG